MEQLVKQVTQQAGINEVQARKAVETVLAYLKKNLPPQYGTMIDTLVTNPAAAQELLKGLGGMLGQK